MPTTCSTSPDVMCSCPHSNNAAGAQAGLVTPLVSARRVWAEAMAMRTLAEASEADSLWQNLYAYAMQLRAGYRATLTP